jgi:hypothetical protein
MDSGLDRRQFLRNAGLTGAAAAGLAALGACNFYLPPPNLPDAPTRATSITNDGGADVTFVAPANQGSSSIKAYRITPKINGVDQTYTDVPIANLMTISGRYNGDSTKYLKASITGLTNDTQYTFGVRAINDSGPGAEVASAANTPRADLVFGDEFNGNDIDPEWWVYNRCGYLAQNEVQGYAPDHCVLDGNGVLQLIAEHKDWTGPRYPSDSHYPGTIVQPWTSGACQSNTRTFAPATGNKLRFEVRQKVNADAGSGFWPGLLWLEGQDYLAAWKTDPWQNGWDDTGKAEIDVAEWYMTGTPDNYGNVSWAGTNEQHNENTGIDLSATFHVYSVEWDPGTSVVFYRDGSQTYSASQQIPSEGAEFFLLLYLQMLSGGSTTTERCEIDYVRVYEVAA